VNDHLSQSAPSPSRGLPRPTAWSFRVPEAPTTILQLCAKRVMRH